MGSLADPRSLDRSLYAEGDPSTLIDPSGHNTFDPLCDCVLAGPEAPGSPPPAIPTNGVTSGLVASATAAETAVAVAAARGRVIAAESLGPTADPDAIAALVAAERGHVAGPGNGTSRGACVGEILGAGVLAEGGLLVGVGGFLLAGGSVTVAGVTLGVGAPVGAVGMTAAVGLEGIALGAETTAVYLVTRCGASQ